MVGGNVEQNGDIGTELVHVVELETAQFYNVPFVWFFCHLQGQTVTNIAGQSGIQACLLEDVVDEGCGGCLAVAAGDAHHLGMGVTGSKLYLTDDGRTLRH